MKKYSLFLLALIFMLGFISQSCNPHGKNNTCASTYYRLNKLNINSLQIKNAAGTNNFYSTDSNAVVPIAQIDMLGMNLRFDVNYYVSHSFRSFSFFPTAQADVPMCFQGTLGTKERIKDIRITSDKDFDAEHLANESLNTLFFVQTNDSANIPLNEYLSAVYLDAPQISLINANVREYFTILLDKKPSLETNHVFKVSVEYTDGRKFESKSWRISFL